MEDVRVTMAVALVLSELLRDVAEPRYGYDLMKATDSSSGKLYPILQRLANAGIVSVEREAVDPSAVGRPVRRMYRLTPEGATWALDKVDAIRRDLAPTQQRSRPALGGA